MLRITISKEQPIGRRKKREKKFLRRPKEM